MPAYRLRLWANIEPALGERIVSPGHVIYLIFIHFAKLQQAAAIPELLQHLELVKLHKRVGDFL